MNGFDNDCVINNMELILQRVFGIAFLFFIF